MLAYDPDFRLYQVSVGATVTRFGYDGVDLIAEYDGSNALLRRYVHGPSMDQPIVWYEGTGTTDRRFLSVDERGSVVAVTDGSGNLLAVNSYDEYGIPGAANIGRFQYTGQAWIPELGMYHYKNRVYSPTLGRFMQTDPIGTMSGINLYAYASNDAVNSLDPFGLDPLTSSQTSIGRKYFGNQINYSKVDIEYKSSDIRANIAFSLGASAITIGDTIHVEGDKISDGLLVHELTHVWQLQTNLYEISELFSWQIAKVLTGEDIYTYMPGGDFDDYGPEVQATIIRDCAEGNSVACGIYRTSDLAQLLLPKSSKLEFTGRIKIYWESNFPRPDVNVCVLGEGEDKCPPH